jgi:hypothetical protein
MLLQSLFFFNLSGFCGLPKASEASKKTLKSTFTVRSRLPFLSRLRFKLTRFKGGLWPGFLGFPAARNFTALLPGPLICCVFCSLGGFWTLFLDPYF